MNAAASTVTILEPPPMPPRPSAATAVPHPVVIPHPAAPALAAAASRAASADEFERRAAQKLMRERLLRFSAPIFGVLVFIAMWAAIAQLGSIPGPAKTWAAAVQVFGDPF